MSRSPYNPYLAKSGSSAKQSPLRQSAPVPADGALSGDGGGSWGLTNMLRNSPHLVAPRPPSSEPSSPSLSGASGGASKSPMAFRTRRFNNAGSASDSDLTATISAVNSAGSSGPDHTRRRSGSENPPVAVSSSAATSSPGALQASGSGVTSGGSGAGSSQPVARQLSSGSGASSSGASMRSAGGPTATILAAYSSNHVPLGGSLLDGAVVAGAAGKALRPKSSDTPNTGSAGGAGGAGGGSSKVLRNRLSEDAGGHAAGTPTLSLREKVAILQRNNKALEQQLAEATNEAQQRAAAQQEAHVAAVAALQQRLTALEGQLAAQQRTTAELTQRNGQLAAQLAEARSRAELAALAPPQPPQAAAMAPTTTGSGDGSGSGSGNLASATPPLPPLVHDKSLVDLHQPTAAGSGEDGPPSPRTPLGWDGLAAGSPATSSSSTISSSGGGDRNSSGSNGSVVGGGSAAAAPVASTTTSTITHPTPPPLPPTHPPSSHGQLLHGGGGSAGGGGSFSRRVSDDALPPHPHIVRQPSASGSIPGVSGGSGGGGADARPHTAPHSNYLNLSLSFGGSAGGGSSAGGCCPEEPLPPETTSLLILSHSEPDFSPGSSESRHLGSSPASAWSASAGGAPASTTQTHGSALFSPNTTSVSGGPITSSPSATSIGEVNLAGAGPPPASPVAAAAGLSGAGVALLARQKKLIESLRAQLQQKESAYAFLANEHQELEGQLKEVEASKREYAARYAFMVLDQDLDGHIRVDQVGSFDMFGCYSPAVLEYAFKHWRFASGFKGYLNMEDFVKFVNLSDDRTSRDSQRFWFGVLDLDGDGCVSAEDAKWFYDAVEKDESAFVVGFEDLWHQLLDMTQPSQPRRGFTASDLWRCKLGAGVVGLLLNHNNMLLHRTTAEWGRGDFPL